MTDTAQAAANEVRWKTAAHPHACSECGGEIVAGETIALWDEIDVAPRCLNEPLRHTHTLRVLCEGCGHLLEDSLTTTADS
jgi:hypothetical protein